METKITAPLAVTADCVQPEYPGLDKRQCQIIKEALTILAAQLRRVESINFTRSKLVKDYLKLKLSTRQREVFACFFLDSKLRIIAYQELFFGTINECLVHPREVVKQAIQYNALAVLLVHNHPSGATDISEADRKLTTRLVEALKLVDVRVLDHFLVGESEVVSFAERGLL